MNDCRIHLLLLLATFFAQGIWCQPAGQEPVSPTFLRPEDTPVPTVGCPSGDTPTVVYRRDVPVENSQQSQELVGPTCTATFARPEYQNACKFDSFNSGLKADPALPNPDPKRPILKCAACCGAPGSMSLNQDQGDTLSHTGAVVGDPHFTGFNGVEFDFQGENNRVFAILSDPTTQLNALFGQDFMYTNTTVMRALGLRHLGDSITVKVKPVDGIWTMFVEANGVAVQPDNRVVLHDSTVLNFGDREADKEHPLLVRTPIYDFHIVLPVNTEKDDVQQWYDRVDLNIEVLSKPSAVHGVLGQTYKRIEAGKNKWEGEVADYICAGLLQTEFKFSQFTNHSLGNLPTNTMFVARRSLHERSGLRKLAVASFRG
ncbi:hypothetical protein WJX72_006770 [[Myrmecia] bisecta]|uniref:Uncharacterized protein n=1 Tax=[Myrmecia] bisecta TaxID=41462 RepID=A0AAW1P1R1_9CHLO